MIDPTAALRLPVSQDVIDQHRQLQSARGVHPLKDRILDKEDPSLEFDVAAIEAAVRAGQVPTQQGTWSTKYAKKIWKLDYSGGVLSQGDGSILDLVWVAIMPTARQAEPVIVLQYDDGSSLLDGSHRLARAWMDGKQSHPSVILLRNDALHLRKHALVL